MEKTLNKYSIGIMTIMLVLALICSIAILGGGNKIVFASNDLQAVQASIVSDVQFDYTAWELVYSDEFDIIDYTKWKYNEFGNGTRRGGYYDHNNISVADGKLILRTNYQESGKYGAGWYTAWLESGTDRNTGAVASNGYTGHYDIYGYYEIRCKMANLPGAWSAFWLQPNNNLTYSQEDIPNTGIDGQEIDVFESMYGGEYTSHVIHYDGYDDRHKVLQSPLYKVDNFYNEFHTYAVEWNADVYRFYIDGYLTWETNGNGTSQVDQYMILSTEIGGYIDSNGKPIPGKSENNSIWYSGNINKQDKTLNYDFVIDYVRVYNSIHSS